MSENKKTWDEKIKLILNELENKINAENAQKSRSQKSRTGRGKNYQTKEEWKRASFCQDIIMQTVMSLAFLLTTVALVQGISKVLPDSITVSNTVGGRELPIYCVETEKPQIALSFDAAWGNAILPELVVEKDFCLYSDIPSLLVNTMVATITFLWTSRPQQMEYFNFIISITTLNKKE